MPVKHIVFLAIALVSFSSLANAQQPETAKLQLRHSTSPRWIAASIPAWIFSRTPAADGSRTIPFLPTNRRGTRIPRCRMRISAACAGFWKPRPRPDAKRSASRSEDWRLLRLLHRREGDRRQGRGTAQAGAGTNCKDRLQGGDRRRGRGHDWRQRPLPLRLDPGFPRRQSGHRQCRSGRTRPARSRLLHQGRRQVGRTAQGLRSRMCRKCSNCSATSPKPPRPKPRP